MKKSPYTAEEIIGVQFSKCGAQAEPSGRR